VTATKSLVARSSSDIPVGNQLVLTIESINELLNRSLFDPPKARRVSGSGSPRRTSIGLGAAMLSDFFAMSISMPEAGAADQSAAPGVGKPFRAGFRASSHSDTVIRAGITCVFRLVP
jgi:hypothetical protein